MLLKWTFSWRRPSDEGSSVAPFELNERFERQDDEETGFVNCTYKGQSSNAQPATPEELIKSTQLVFQGCTDGKPVGAERTGTQFELTVNPIPNYPVTVQPPLQRPDVCEDMMEILSPADTYAMRQGFNWSAASEVDPKIRTSS